MKVKLLEPIEGFEDVAEYRVPKDGEPVCSSQCKVVVADVHLVNEMLVLTPVERWRPATIDDAVRAIQGEKVVARAKDESYDTWKEIELAGYRRGGVFPWLSKDSGFVICEVLDA